MEVMEARKVSSGYGWMWIKQGYWLFKKSPVLWIVLTALCVVGMFALNMIPLLGDPLSTLVFPGLLAGLMLGCHALAKGEQLELPHLFSGFKQHAHKLITLGGINLVGQLLILGVVKVTGGSALVDVMVSGNPADEAVLRQALAGTGFAVALGATLFTMLLMAMQFAPMLVVFRKITPVAAMRASLRACLLNFMPLTVYGLLLLPFGVCATLPWMMGWPLLLPVIVCSLYAIYRDLFPMEEDMVPPAAEAAPVTDSPAP
ncbi:MAG: BPSS1780 family membrane protein [Pseudomonadota bacterium]